MSINHLSKKIGRNNMAADRTKIPVMPTTKTQQFTQKHYSTRKKFLNMLLTRGRKSPCYPKDAKVLIFRFMPTLQYGNRKKLPKTIVV